jgi:hypothetical protein
VKRICNILQLGRLVCLALLFVIGSPVAQGAAKGSFDVGLGLGFVDSADFEGFDGGLDLQFGYEWNERQKWYVGAQLHVIRGFTSSSDVIADTDMSFDSVAATFTFRPKKPAARWIQLKAGIVHADYQTAVINSSGFGFAAGVGVVLGSESKVRFHLLDYSRYEIGSHGFNVYSLGIALMAN